jgi:hypothetical protein
MKVVKAERSTGDVWYHTWLLAKVTIVKINIRRNESRSNSPANSTFAIDTASGLSLI